MPDQTTRPASTVELIAHRGYTLHYPENTLLALRAAIDAGARFLEVDVQLAADGTPLLFHDDTLERVCGVPGAIHDYDTAALSRLRASEFDRFGYRYAQTPIAALADLCSLLAAKPEVTAFVEIKALSLAQFGVSYVLERILPPLESLPEQVVLISFEREVLAAARERSKLRIGGVVERWRDRRALKDLSPDFLFCDVGGLPRWGRLRFGRAHLAVYEVDDAAQALRLAERGVQFIETFAVGEMRRVLASHAA